MNVRSNRFTKAFIMTAAATSVVMMASCASPRTSPKQVATSNPTVTYQYRNDDELVQANQRAITFCEPYQSLPQSTSFSTDAEGRKVVVFECVRDLQANRVDSPDSTLRYSYRTDQQLLQLSRDAQVHCMKIGQPEMTSNIVVNADGSRTVTFQCNRR